MYSRENWVPKLSVRKLYVKYECSCSFHLQTNAQTGGNRVMTE